MNSCLCLVQISVLCSSTLKAKHWKEKDSLIDLLRGQVMELKMKYVSRRLVVVNQKYILDIFGLFI